MPFTVDAFRSLLAAIGEVVFYASFSEDDVNHVGSLLYLEGPVTETFGYSSQEFKDDPLLWSSIIHPDDAEPLKSATLAIYESGGAGTVFYRHRHGGTRKYHWAEERLAPHFSSDGRLSGIFGISRDITEQRHTEEQRDALLLAVEQSADMLMITDKSGNLQYVNAAFERLMGYSAAEIVGRPYSVIGPGSDLRSPTTRLGRAVSSGKAFRGSVDYTTKNGALLPLEVFATVLKNSSNNLVGYLSSGREIGELHRAHELELQLKTAEQAERFRMNILGIVSHELRTPLAAIIAYATAILDYGDRLGPDKPANYLKNIEKRGRELERLIDDLLTMSRLESSGLTMNFEVVNIGALLFDVVSEWRDRTEHEFEISVAGVHLHAKVDTDRIRQVIRNLIDNATKFSEPGTVIQISSQPSSAKSIEVSIRDHGPGVDITDLDLIFQSFYRGSGAQIKNVPGSGLGLAICMSLVEAHGGEISLDLPSGGGLAVTFSIPRTPDLTDPQ